MSRKIQNTLFITLNILALLSFNIILISCDELKKSIIKTKNNMLIEVTSEPQFFNTVKQTLDSFDQGVFISFDYVDPKENLIQMEQQSEEIEDQEYSDNYLNYNEEKNYLNNFNKGNENEVEFDDFDNEENEDFDYEENDDFDYEENDDFDYEENLSNINENSNDENEKLLENDFSEELDIEQLEIIEKELANYEIEGKSEEELMNKLNQVKSLLKKINNEFDENSIANRSFESDKNDISKEEDEMNKEYFDEIDQNSLLRFYALDKIGDIGIEQIEDCGRRNIKRLTLFTMFNMETEVKFNMNSAL